jgi:hypothetical protein
MLGWEEIALRTIKRSFLLRLVGAGRAARAIAAVLASTSAICA